MYSDRIHFTGAAGQRIGALLDRPNETPRAFALLAHCFTCNKDYKAINRISRTLAERGLGVLRFDFTGLGDSEGEFADTNFSSNLEDLVAAADFLRAEHAAPRLLVGHSLGGLATLAAAGRIPEAAAVATIGAPSSTKHLHDILAESSPALHEAGEAEVLISGRPIRIKRQMLEDFANQELDDVIRKLEVPLLLFHSPIDETVSIDHAARLYALAPHPKSFISLNQADHLLARNPADARFVGEVLAAWAGRYLETD